MRFETNSFNPLGRRISALIRFAYNLSIELLKDASGNFAIALSVMVPMIIVAAGGAVDVSRALAERDTVQGMLDAGVLSAVKLTDPTSRQSEVQSFLMPLTAKVSGLVASDVASGLTLANNADGSLTANFNENFKTTFLPVAGISQFPVRTSSTAYAQAAAATTSASPCLYVLANQSQALLVNSGANIASKACEVEVASVANPAFIMNSGSTIATAKFCVKGTQYINNGGKITNFNAGCSVDVDPYAGTLAEPAVSST